MKMRFKSLRILGLLVAVMCFGREVRSTLADFIKSVDEELEEEDLNLVLEMLREYNKIKVTCPHFAFLCMYACAFQELKHLRSVGKKDIVYPDGFPGGLKGLVKSVLEEFGKQFSERVEDDVPRGVTAG